MKSTVWISAAVLVAGSICGCGEKKESSNAVSTVDHRPTVTQPSVDQVTVKSSTPQEAVTEFLDALRSGNDKTAEALLTVKAREETAAHDMVVAPPGAPNATYSVGRVQHPDDQKDAAYVSCTWSEKNGNEAVSYEVVWILRQETGGWRIAGMATQLAEAEEPVFLNFEDLSQLASELENAEREAEVANRPQTSPPPQDVDNATLR
jgi:hypothetical protein